MCCPHSGWSPVDRCKTLQRMVGIANQFSSCCSLQKVDNLLGSVVVSANDQMGVLRQN